MDGITSPDMSAASVDIAPPSGADTSAVSNEAVMTEQSPSLDPQSESPLGESSAPSLEFPDDAALEALPASERQSNWQQLRNAYTSAKSDAEAYQQYKPHIESITEMGGFDRFQQQAELGGLLFSQVENPQTGQLEMSAAPFVERLASDSPDTLNDLVWQGIMKANPANPNESIGHSFLRDYVGLSPDPKMLDFYRQFQTQQDVNQFLAQSGQVTSEELATIPEQFHEAYRSLTPTQRAEFELFSNDAVKQEYLQDKADALQARQYIAEQNAEREQARQQQAAEFNRQVEARGSEIAKGVQETLLNSVREKLKTDATFSAEEGVNSSIHDESIQWAVQKTLSDPALQQDSTRAEQLYTLSARAEMTGDKFKAQEFKVQADNLARKLEGRFRAALNERTAFWSKAFGVSRQAQQQTLQNARPRPELGASNVTQGSQQPNANAERREGFGFSSQQMEQYKAMMRARQMGQ